MRRLTFTFRNGTIELVSQQRVEMIAPGRPGAPDVGEAEFVYEVRDAEANVLHRSGAPDPLPVDVEVFSDDPARSVERSPNPPAEGAFTVLLPDLADAEEVRLLRSPRAGAAALGPAHAARFEAAAAEGVAEIARFKLDKL